MLKRINQYLLTHYPLLWNTRVVWMLLVNLALHVLYYAAGYIGYSAKESGTSYHLRPFNNENVLSFAILTGILVVIVWLIYYLRNNALKNKYPLRKTYLAGETLLVILILFTTITYLTTYNAGVRAKLRHITPQAIRTDELRTLTQAFTFLPHNWNDYFLLNNCEAETYSIYELTDDRRLSGIESVDSAKAMEWAALERPDAFSYRHFCFGKIEDDHLEKKDYRALNAVNNHLLATGNKDSIERLLRKSLAILDKYGINYRLNVKQLVNAPFENEQHKPNIMVSTDAYNFNVRDARYAGFLDFYAVDRVYAILDDSHTPFFQDESLHEVLLFEGYFAFVLAILLICYRRFTKKVYLATFVGALVLGVLIAIMTASTFTGVEGILLALFLLFGLAGYVLTAKGNRKATSGVLLSWHAALLPFLMIIILELVRDYYNKQSYRYKHPDDFGQQEMDFPISYWILQHTDLLMVAFLFIAIAYFATLWNAAAKRWQANPEQ